MKTIPKLIIIAKDGWPLEEIKGKPVINFIRRLLHGHHKECEACWLNRQAGDSCDTVQQEPK